MFGKFFASTFTGSMFGAGPDVFAVWGYVIAHAVEGVVELNPALLGAMLGCPADRIDAAIRHLCEPDPQSRNPAEDGRRLIHQGAFTYRVVSHGLYRAMRNEDDRRAYNAQKQRESRARRAGTASTDASLTRQQSRRNVNAVCRRVPRSAHTEAEAEAEKKEQERTDDTLTVKALTCATCGKETTVPFAPDPSRPIYCQACYAEQKPVRTEKEAVYIRAQVWGRCPHEPACADYQACIELLRRERPSLAASARAAGA